MTNEWRTRPQVLAIHASCAAILFGFAAMATAQVPSSGAEQQQLAQLRQQVSVLEKRVTELEKTKGSATRGDESAQAAKDSAGTKALEQRLAALEQAQAAKDSAGTKALEQRLAGLEQAQAAKSVTVGSDKATTVAAPIAKSATVGPNKETIVTAPFVVVDRGGKVVMRVQADPIPGAASRGIYMFGIDGTPLAHMGEFVGGVGRVYATHRNAPRPQISLLAETLEVGAALQVYRVDGKTFNSLGTEGLKIRNGEGKLIGSITSQTETGYLELSDRSGNAMLEAGTTTSQKGYVKANPYRASTSPQGDPSVLMGGKK